ncbi:MAG: S46 family peptidase [Bacteroidaceae bacterium]|nr:S46 family peptidase [Bacteroidaceae bacterium]
MKKFFLSFVAASCICLSALADEGMWVIGNISQRTDSVLRSLGLELTPEELYSSEKPSLNDAIIQLGGFCSGSIVSDQGLLFTNHHCGYDAIQTHSSVKHDYLKNGFFAKTLKDELPNEDLYVLFHIKTIDVTDRILSHMPKNADAATEVQYLDSVSRSICDMVTVEKEGIYGEINSFYKGSKFFLSVYQRYDDVRLVAAPPQCLGKYGGDTDNWMWPRQTCDFSVFRVYAGPDNLPAKYSEHNVPLKPIKYAKISTQGYKAGDYSMTLGYPGSTDRYLSSYGIYTTMHCTNDVRYQVRTVKLDVMKEAMRSSDKLRIMYASKQASSSNYWKFSLGQNQALENLKVIDEKRALEAKVQAWIDADTVAHARYVGVLDSIKVINERNFDIYKTYNMFVESFIQGSDILQSLVYYCFGRVDFGNKTFAEVVEETYKDIDVPTDKAIFAALLKNYIEKVPLKQFIPSVIQHNINELHGGNVDAYVDQLYANSVFADAEKLKTLRGIEDAADDPMYEAAIDVLTTFMQANAAREGAAKYERLLGEAIREMNHDKEYYPDANFTMRLSYGICEPIHFAPGTTGLKEEATNLVTTPQSFLNKHDKEPDNMDYELIDPVYKWMKSGKFSPQYIDKATGKLPLCFLTTNDITGGNSGSGMYDGKGRMIGLAFDGNWEAMSGDLKFDADLQRCIGVDIRWVLSVLDDYLGAKRLIKELDIE